MSSPHFPTVLINSEITDRILPSVHPTTGPSHLVLELLSEVKCRYDGRKASTEGGYLCVVNDALKRRCGRALNACNYFPAFLGTKLPLRMHAAGGTPYQE